jgi:FkbM family methyltransferase
MLFQRAVNELHALVFSRSEESGFFASCWDRVEIYRSYRIYTRLDGAVTPVEGKAPPDGMRLWNTPCGFLWAPPSERSTLVFCIGEQERGFYGTGRRGVQAGDIVLDCGASFGTFTRHASNLGARLVVAVEPGPDAARCLARTFADDSRVVVQPVGVWDEDGALTLIQSAVTSAANSFVLPLEQAHGEFEVSVRTIDSLVESLSLPRVDFIKMDIEGAECKALAGAHRTLQTWKPRLAICTYHLPDDPRQIAALVHSIRPDYQMEYGFRKKVRDRITPRVAHFW